MKVSIAIGAKIKKMMEERKVSLRQLSQEIGVTHPTMSKYVEGIQPIDSDKLMKIASFFNKPFDYFFKSDSQQYSFMLRADRPNANVCHIDIDNMVSIITDYTNIMTQNDYIYIPPMYHLPLHLFQKKSDIPKEFYDAIEKIAYEQRKNFNIEHIVPDNYFDTVEKAGINLIIKDFKNDDFFACSSYSEDKGCFIIINDSKNISEERKIFSLFHEYAHLIFNRNQYKFESQSNVYNYGRSDVNEKIANTFAGYFLLPRYLVEQYIQTNGYNLIKMKHYFKVSAQSLVFNLRNYNLIDADQSQKMNSYLYNKEQKKAEPHPMEMMPIEDKNYRLINQLKTLYFQDEISVSKISQILGLEVQDTRNLLKKWRDIDEESTKLTANFDCS